MAAKKRNPKLAGMIGAIKMGKKALGMDDATYEGYLLREVGKSSCADMDAKELGKVLDAMRRDGFRAKDDPKLAAQRRLFKALWHEMHDQGIVQHATDQAMNNYAIRICRAPLDSLTLKQVQALIECLKKWWSRASDQPGAAKLYGILAGHVPADGVIDGKILAGADHVQ